MIESNTNPLKYLGRKEIWCYLIVVLLAGALTAVCEALDPSLMQLYFGRISPFLLLILLASLGTFLLGYLKRFQFDLYRKNSKGLLSAVIWACLFTLAIIVVEHVKPLAQDINVPYPRSLVFYPAIIFYVEMIFHILPLAVILFLIRKFIDEERRTKGIWIPLILVALLEPLFQTWMSDQEGYHSMLVSYIALHIFLINLVQLHLYRKYDFLTMLLFRLAYYLLWHVLWGHFRLAILF